MKAVMANNIWRWFQTGRDIWQWCGTQNKRCLLKHSLKSWIST